ncbi:hypothetical protein [Tahibacter harae]|uniref:Uncharacterized protein n=1 Tax=Tahibacter harae TaxID=2963937 RepID=A0ABT1QWY5_9GAMM|nr:hypothetical protein [Tahibacter harae]MCQ4166795.1 hypothetical protein [Tahibacter harae]
MGILLGLQGPDAATRVLTEGCANFHEAVSALVQVGKLGFGSGDSGSGWRRWSFWKEGGCLASNPENERLPLSH